MPDEVRIQFVDELPPSRKGDGTNPRWDYIALTLLDKPNTWAIIDRVPYDKKRGSQVRTWLEQRDRAIEVAERKVGDEAVIYARYVVRDKLDRPENQNGTPQGRWRA